MFISGSQRESRLFNMFWLVLAFQGLLATALESYGPNNYYALEDFEDFEEYLGNESVQTKSLQSYLQVDDIDSGLYDDPDNLPENSCTRPCVRGDTRTCYYRFNFEPYTTLSGACAECLSNQTHCYNAQCVSADGFERAILTINRRMPAPSIQVCEGDEIIVDVHNMMGGRSTAVHWHGLTMKNSKFMDGVPLVTQCPIQEGSTFRYKFTADSWGMHFYHSHDGLQKVDGLVGSLVVRLPKEEDPNAGEYDFDLPSHVLVVQDWYHLTADSLFPGFRYNDTEQVPTTFLIQGRGQFVKEDGNTLYDTPLAEFSVSQGYRYVFRLVAGSCYDCQYIFTIEDHDFLIIGGDGRPTQPYRVDSLTMSPGERFTVVVNANRTVGSYWMQVRSTGFCTLYEAHQVAILRYDGGPEYPTTERPDNVESATNAVGITMNPLNSDCSEESRDKLGPCISDLRSAYEPTPGITNAEPDVRIVWLWNYHAFQNSSLFNVHSHHKYLQANPALSVGFTINGIVNTHPPAPILSQPEDVSPDLLCSADLANLTTWKTTHRECVHVMKVPANSIVEIINIDNVTNSADAISHSIHLHGYDLYMLEMGLLNPDIPKNDAILELLEYLDSDQRPEIPSQPASKDTFPLSAGGYAVTRIYTGNPGYWFFHCHFAYHLDSGMSAILQVGEPETFPTPPKGFPKCNNFLYED